MREKARRAHVDANVILRLLLGEPEDQAHSSKASILSPVAEPLLNRTGVSALTDNETRVDTV